MARPSPSASPSGSPSKPLLVLIASLAAAAVVDGTTREADAADPQGSGADCSVKGKGVIEKGVTIYSAKEGGTAIAGFATQEITVEVSDFPAEATGRAKVKTGKGSGSVRIEGWMDPTKVPLSAKQDLAVVANHVWIGRGEAVKLRGSSPGKLHVDTTLSSTQQKLSAKVACSNFSIGKVQADEFESPKSASRYVLKNKTLDLYDEPSGSVIFTIEVPNAEAGVLLWSTESKSVFVRVKHFGQLVVDAWAKTGDLKPFPKGEMLDALNTSSMVSISPAKLKVDGSTKEVKVSKDVPIRLSANDKSASIGVIEDGAEVIVVDTMAGWSRVFPKNLEVIPPDGKDFWAKASDLGL